MIAHAATKRIPVLWLVEHIAREMDVACAAKALAMARHGLDITVRHVYLHANELMRGYQPGVVVLPFFYKVTDMAIEDYVRAWPRATFFNLTWEQIHYTSHAKIKAPGDDFTRSRVIHHAWGDFHRRYLMEHGVPEQHIFVNGQPAYRLYQPPYSRYYKSRQTLAAEYGLDPGARWVFFPENYRWAFVSQSKIDRWIAEGSDPADFKAMREFCETSLGEVIRWCNDLARQPGVQVIFRPRPATSLGQMREYCSRFIQNVAPGLRIIKDESVREWVLASDVVASSYSTTLIEAAVAGKPILMAEPAPIPPALHCDWYQYVPRLRTGEEFVKACLNGAGNDGSRLGDWAQAEMLSRGDPIEGLADYTAALALQGLNQPSSVSKRSPMAGLPAPMPQPRTSGVLGRTFSLASRLAHRMVSGPRRLAPPDPNHNRPLWRGLSLSARRLAKAPRYLLEAFRPRERDYFSRSTHEQDEFTEKDVRALVGRWAELLMGGKVPQGEPLVSVIICTYNQAGLLRKCLDSLSRQEGDPSGYEVIVVDNNSFDDTLHAASAFEHSMPNLRYCLEPNQGLSHARNRGAAAARGRYLAYIDDDVTVPPRYMTTVLDIIRTESPDIFGGPAYPSFADGKPHRSMVRLYTRKSESESGFSATCRVHGCNFIIQRKVLDRLGGFDVALGMKGNSIGLGEEGKVLATYRAVTPGEQQRVYYSLDCFVLHFTAPEKTRFRYVMARSWVTGTTHVRRRAETEEITLGSVAKTGLEGTRVSVRLLLGEIKRHGPFATDYNMVMRVTLSYLGRTVEGLNLALRGPRKRSRGTAT